MSFDVLGVLDVLEARVLVNPFRAYVVWSTWAHAEPVRRAWWLGVWTNDIMCQFTLQRQSGISSATFRVPQTLIWWTSMTTR